MILRDETVETPAIFFNQRFSTPFLVWPPKQRNFTHIFLQNGKFFPISFSNGFVLAFTFFFNLYNQENNTPLWSRIIKNSDCKTGRLARPFPCSLALPTRSLAPHRLLCSCAPLRSTALHCAHLYTCLLTSLTPSLVGKWILRWQFFLCFLFYSGP